MIIVCIVGTNVNYILNMNPLVGFGLMVIVDEDFQGQEVIMVLGYVTIVI